MSAFTNTPPPSAPPTEHCSLDDIAKFIDETERFFNSFYLILIIINTFFFFFSYARRADWQLRRAFAFADKNGFFQIVFQNFFSKIYCFFLSFLCVKKVMEKLKEVN